MRRFALQRAVRGRPSPRAAAVLAALAFAAGCGGDDGATSTAATTAASGPGIRDEQPANVGAAVFARHCASCHGIEGRAPRGTTGEYGPSFDHVRLRNRPYVEFRIEYGGVGMQSFATELTDAERDAVVGYLLARSGSRVADEPLARYERVAGARLFDRHCASCHAIAGRAATGRPTYPGTDFGVVVPSYDLAVERTIHGYYWWMPAFRQLEEREIKAVARYVQKVAGGHPFVSPIE